MAKPISFEEEDRMLWLRKQGWSYHRIARDLGRNPAAVLRTCTGERGAIRKAHKIKPWRCGGCGGRIIQRTCLACEINQRNLLKRKAATSRWADAINRNKTKRDDVNFF